MLSENVFCIVKFLLVVILRIGLTSYILRRQGICRNFRQISVGENIDLWQLIAVKPSQNQHWIPWKLAAMTPRFFYSGLIMIMLLYIQNFDKTELIVLKLWVIILRRLWPSKCKIFTNTIFRKRDILTEADGNRFREYIITSIIIIILAYNNNT